MQGLCDESSAVGGGKSNENDIQEEGDHGQHEERGEDAKVDGEVECNPEDNNLSHFQNHKERDRFETAAGNTSESKNDNERADKYEHKNEQKNEYKNEQNENHDQQDGYKSNNNNGSGSSGEHGDSYGQGHGEGDEESIGNSEHSAKNRRN